MKHLPGRVDDDHPCAELAGDPGSKVSGAATEIEKNAAPRNAGTEFCGQKGEVILRPALGGAFEQRSGPVKDGQG